VFYLYDDGGTDEEERIGMVVLSMAGRIEHVSGWNYNDVDDPVFGTYPHPMGNVGLERTGARFDVFELHRQTVTVSGGPGRGDRVWYCDGKYLWVHELDRQTTQPRKVSAGGSVGQGTDNTYNCHALTRRTNGDIVWMSFEYQDLGGGGTDLRIRIRSAYPGTGTTRFDVLSDHDSSNETTLPYIDQPYQWDIGGGTRGGNSEFPWCPLALGSPKEVE
jgi:hypothetical protein